MRPPFLPHAPIGIYDSGVGGFSVLADIQRLLPRERLLYVADTAHVPYGEKTAEYVLARACRLADFFVSRGAKAIAIPCNTATAAAVAQLRARHPGLPIIGIEPAVKPAATLTRSGVVGVLATSGTLASARFAALMAREAPNARVLMQPCPEWVTLVERGELNTPAVQASVDRALTPLLAQGADVLVLGCTHFPFLQAALRRRVGPDLPILETGAAFARQLQRRLAEQGTLRPSGIGRCLLLASGDPAPLRAHARALLGQAFPVGALPADYC